MGRSRGQRAERVNGRDGVSLAHEVTMEVGGRTSSVAPRKLMVNKPMRPERASPPPAPPEYRYRRSEVSGPRKVSMRRESKVSMNRRATLKREDQRQPDQGGPVSLLDPKR